MVAAVRHPAICKRFLSDTFAPPSGFHSDARGPDVSAEEILAGGVRESDRSFPVLISTPSQDRQGDVVHPEGCDYSAFALSPCVYFEHQDIKFSVGSMRGPDGRLYLCIVPGKGILGRIWIRKSLPDDPKGYAEACDTVWILVREGRLNGLSPGFDPLGYVKELRGGGNEYKTWELLEVSLVNIAANRDCRVLREPFSWDDAILKRFSPSVIKGLKIMSIASAVHKSPKGNTHDIKKRGDKWVILDNDTRKELSSHDSREEAVAAMRALQYHKHGGKSTEPATEKGMSESSGTGGGYTMPEEHKAMCGEIAKRMGDHEADGHSLHFHPETGDLHHSYPDGADEEKIKAIAGDLHDVPGVRSMTQEPEAGPKGEGYHKVYPKDDDGEVEESHKAGVTKGSRYAQLGKAAFSLVRKQRLKSWGIERAVRRIMPRLQKSGMPDKQAITRAWYVAALQKGWMPIVEKAMDDEPDGDGDEDDAPDGAEDAVDDATTETAMDVPEEEATGGPDGLELVQTAIENLEAALPKLEPERRAFWSGIIDQIRDHGEETYPDEDFGGEDTEGKEAAAEGDNDTEEQKTTDKMLERYKSYRPVHVKRISVVRKLKSLQKDPMVADTLRKAANHLHSIGDMHAEFDDKKGHAILKGYTVGDHRGCRKMARDLDRVHGAITKGEEKPKEGDTAQGGDDFDMNEIGSVMKSLCEREDEISRSQREMGDKLFAAAGVRRRA